ncbi:two-component system response regulator [Vibrio sp. V19_P1S1T109]|uniref:response regulator n=1 Tax=Vibrio sp. V19_P1S1T109 TaxID=1938672 RepID=UPI000B8E4022|nr:response regulator [Vibrio sp. V19_P1S1T109]OXX75362.1 two-component system response regulator [Vibrio sp. V19_P1S1T109]
MRNSVMNKTVLVVDDSASIRQVVSMTLKGAGYQTIEAHDGKDALSKLAGNRVHLVISDVNMPNMDGITLLKELKQRPDTKFTPVIMLTTESEASKKEQGRAAGAKAWVVKPFAPEQMLAAVAKLIQV